MIVRMLRISLPYITDFAVTLHQAPILNPQSTVASAFFSVFDLKEKLYSLLHNSVYAGSLRVCRLPGISLIGAATAVTSIAGWDDAIEPSLTARYNSALSLFQVTFNAELEVMSSYLVTGKRGYDIPTLIDDAMIIFPPELLQKVPGVQYDIREAGRCIAFEVTTAAGFHLMRALETVITTYWSVVMNGEPLPENRNLGSYIQKMSDAKIAGTDKVLAALKQMKDLHRNPLMHPEDKLDLDGCIGLLNIIQSAMTAMLQRIPVQAELFASQESLLPIMTSHALSGGE